MNVARMPPDEDTIPGDLRTSLAAEDRPGFKIRVKG
jgi:hypothetical protein